MFDAKPRKINVIPKRELLAYRAALKLQIYRQIRKAFNNLKVSQKDLAARLGVDEGLLSRRLRGENDMRLETFSDLARGLDHKIEVRLVEIAEIRRMIPAKERELWTDTALTIQRPGVEENIDLLTVSNVAFSSFTVPKPPSSQPDAIAETSLAVSHG
jgi:transcriptional regulator with XRE-family HTH domain